VCRTPELAVEVTLQPIRAFEFDAAILFSDLLVPLAPMGIPFDFHKGEGPVIEAPVRSAGDVAALRRFEPREELGFALEAIRLLRRELQVPLIGFAGAPFTLAAYLIEGGSSRTFDRTRAFLRADEGAWHALLRRLVPVLAGPLNAQIRAGAQAVQVFDSWVGCLTPDEYRRYVLPHSRALLRAVGRRAPVIHFGTRTGPFLETFRDAGGTVIGVDHRIPLAEARRRLGLRVAVQGNLDPAALLLPPGALRREAKRVLAGAGRRPGFIFNLGHGVLPATPPASAKALVDFVHEATAA
jgi:uroporphyrinogen decarboxylase